MSEQHPDAESGIYDTPGPSQAPQQPAEGAGESAVTPEKVPAKEFPQRHREALTGLLFLGYLEDKFEWLGHDFVIRTRTTGEQIQCGIIAREAIGTRTEGKALSTAAVAAAVVSVDGMALITPVEMGKEPSLRERHEKVLKWYPPVIDKVYDRLYALESEARAVVDAMGEAYGQGTSTPG